MYLDETLNFNLRIKEKVSKARKAISIIRRLSNSLSRDSLLTIYKSFVRSHLDYGDIIYDKPNSESFTQKSKEFSTIRPSQLQMPSKEHLRVSCTSN